MKPRRTPVRAAVPKRPRLAVSPGQSRELVKFAGILEIRPQDCLSWILADLLESFSDPMNGLLLNFAEEQVAYDTPEQTERVRARAAAWLKRREAINSRRDGKGGSAS